MSAPLHPIVRARWLVLALVLALAAWLVPGALLLRHDEDVLAFLPPDHPDVIAFHAVADRFGMLSVGLVGLEANGEDLLVPGHTETIRQLGRELADLPGVRLVLSYPDLPDAGVQGDTLVVDALVPLAIDTAAEIRRRVLANGNAVGNVISSDGTAAALLVYFLGEADASVRSRELAAIRSTVRARWHGDVHFGGGPFLEDVAARSSRADIERLSPVVIAVLGVASALLLRSFAGAVLNLLVTGLGVLLIVGAHGRFGEPFTIVSSTTPVMMVALGGAFGMHVIAGYQRMTGSPAERASAALRELWLPVVLSAVTTAATFFVLLVMPQAPMQRFGVVAGLGVLLLLALALVVLPAVMSFLPRGALVATPTRVRVLRFVPPLWVLGGLAVVGVVLGARLEADPDTRNVFDADSEPAHADRFFNAKFGGSQFVQIAIETDLGEPTVLFRIRELVQELARIDGVAEVRSLIDPVELLTEGFGGQRRLPGTPAQARRVITNLADQAPMAQLMTDDGKGAIVHVKLVPQDSARTKATTAAIREQVGASLGTLAVGTTSDPAVADALRRAVMRRIESFLGRKLGAVEQQAILDRASVALPPDELEALRDRAFATDELIEPLPPERVAAIDPGALLAAAPDGLASHLRRVLPELASEDPEGIEIVARHLGGWLEEARARQRIRSLCERLGVPNEAVSPPPQAAEDDPFAGLEDDVWTPVGRCAALFGMVSELEDAEGIIPAGAKAKVVRTVPFDVTVTGQPIIGQAFAESVTRSLWISTLVSMVALALVLAIAGHPRALLPATWTLAVTAGVVAILGHPISVGTSMVSCISLGAGVDFAIHLAVRARATSIAQQAARTGLEDVQTRTGREDAPGRIATNELGVVVLATGLELALAFLVLLASSMPPLREFGVGLAFGLLIAAAGAVWFTPRLYP